MKIAFLGDSITEGRTILNPSKDRFSALVCRDLGLEELNLGIGGTLMARAGMNRFPNGGSFVERAVQMEGADFGVIFGGTNDYFWTDTLNEFTGQGDELSFFRPAVSYVFDRAVRFFGADNTLVITPYPHHGFGNYIHGNDYLRGRWHDTDAPNIVGMTLEDYSDVLKEEAEKRSMPLLDIFTLYGRHTAGFDWQNLTTDGCHPNEKGHRLLADLIIEKISDKTRHL